MKSLRLIDAGKLELVETPSEHPGYGKVKIKVEKTTISLPDLQAYMGKTKLKYPITLGRNCVGMIIEVGEGVSEFKRGDKVYVCSKKFCGQCSACKSGHHYLCDNFITYGYDTDGFMRDFAIIDAGDCAIIPERLSSTEAVFLDNLSLANQVVTALKLSKGEYVAISGSGLLGLILAEVSLYSQAIPILVDTDKKTLALAERLGIYYTINSEIDNPKTKVFHITGGKMAKHSVVITSGNMDIKQSLSFAGVGSRVAIVERPGMACKQSCPVDIIQNNLLSIFGVNGGKNISVAINMLTNKAIDLSALTEKTISFEEIPVVMADLASKENDYHLQYIVNI